MRFLKLPVFICLFTALIGANQAPPERPIPAIRHAVIISCDGFRPDLILRAKTPNMRSLMERGSYSFWARTVPVAITLPSHVSMLTGVRTEKHGVTWNDDEPDLGPPKVPTIFELAKQSGYSTAIAAGKSKFATLVKPNTVDWADIQAAKDDRVAEGAVKIIQEHQPGVMFIHFPGGDHAGHRYGWGSRQQIDAIENIDAQLGKIIDAIDKAGLTDSTVVLISADHGGAGKTHGGSDPRSRHIPWIIAGPGIRANRDLTAEPTLHIDTQDTFATICYLLGIPQPPHTDGKPIKQVVEKKELLEKKR